MSSPQSSVASRCKSVVACLLLLSAAGSISVASASKDAAVVNEAEDTNKIALSTDATGEVIDPSDPRVGPAPSDYFMKNLEKFMPDLSDETTNAHLRCSACSAIAHELYDRLTVINERALAKGYKSGAKDFEFVDEMDLACREMHKTWGLKVYGDSIEPEYVHASTTKYQIRSGWAMSFLQDRCAEITDVHEEKIFRLARRGRELAEWLEYTCVVLDKTCTSTEDSPANVAFRRAAEEEEKKKRKAEALAKKKAEEAAAKKKNEEKEAAKQKKSNKKTSKQVSSDEKTEVKTPSTSAEKEMKETVAAAHVGASAASSGAATEGNADL